jgi:hypothetical protein
MAATQDQRGPRATAQEPAPIPAKVFIGSAVMALGVALTGYGAHFLVKNGTCPGTGQVDYGPVARCSGTEAPYIMSVFVIGPLAGQGQGDAGGGPDALAAWVVRPDDRDRAGAVVQDLDAAADQ